MAWAGNTSRPMGRFLLGRIARQAVRRSPSYHDHGLRCQQSIQIRKTTERRNEMEINGDIQEFAGEAGIVLTLYDEKGIEPPLSSTLFTNIRTGEAV